MPPPAVKFDVFLSHNGQDKPAVERLAEKLKRAGFVPWLDKWALTPGGRWQDELHAGLLACRAFAYFIGVHGEGDWAREELDAARSRAANDREFRIFPVLLPGVADPFDRTTMPPFLGARTWVDFRAGLDDGRAFQSLINAIKGVPLGSEVVPATALDVVPYRGLDPFDEDDAEFFYGREPDVQTLLEKLKGSRFLAVMGPSGSGKSSLVRAGLVPVLRRGALSGSQDWSIEILKPGGRPLETLAARLQGIGTAAGMAQTIDGLASDERTLHLASSLALGDAAERRFVWVIDQAEEVFTLCHDEHERERFVANLSYAASVPGGRGIVILAMRADFYARCAAYPDLSAQVARSQHLVSPLTPDGIRDAIEEPARRVGLEFEEGLIGTILDDLESQPGALPLLEYALLELWKRRRGSMLTLEGYRESGGVQGAIAKRAETIFAAFTPAEQEIARRALLRLTAPGEGTEDTRRRASMRELITRPEDTEQVSAVVNELTDARLLTATADAATGESLVDISHEALIRAWPRVRQWLDEDRAGQRVLRRITEASQEWERLGRDDGLLYRGARLAEASEWRETHDEMLNDLERLFVDASSALIERERQARERTRRLVTVAAVVLAAVFLVLAGVAGLQWQAAEGERATAEQRREEADTARAEADRRAAEAEEQRRQAEAARADAEEQRRLAVAAVTLSDSRLLASQALNNIRSLDRGLLLSLEANLRSDVVDVRASLLRLLTAEPRLLRYAGESGGAVSDLAVSADGSSIVWGRADGTLLVAAADHPDTLRLATAFPDAAVTALAISADGTRLVAAAGGLLRAWDVATGAVAWERTLEGAEAVVRLTFAGKQSTEVAAAWSDGSVVLLRAADGTLIDLTVPPEERAGTGQALGPIALSFSADGAQLARSEQDLSITLWNVHTGRQRTAPLPQTLQAVDLAFELDDTQISILYASGFSVYTPLPTPSYVGPLATGIPDGFRIINAGAPVGFLVASANQGIRYLSYASLAASDLYWETIDARPDPVALTVSPDGGTLVIGYADGRLGIARLGDRWSLATRIPDLPALAPGLPAQDAPVDIRADGGAVAWYDAAAQGIAVQGLDGGAAATVAVSGTVQSLALFADGTRVASVEAMPDGADDASHLLVRRIADGVPVLDLPLGPTRGWRVAVSADGTAIALGDVAGTLEVLDVTTGALRWTAAPDTALRAVTALAFTADGGTLLVGGRPRTGDGSRAVLLSYETAGGVRIGEPLPIDADRVGAIASSPDGTLLAVAGADAQAQQDGQLLMVDTQGPVVIGSLGGPGDDYAALRFSADGATLTSAGPASGWFGWVASPDGWASRACAIASRDLSQAEWKAYIGDTLYHATCSDLARVGTR